MARMTKAEKQRIIAEREARHAAAIAIVREGKCPKCGSAIRRNLSMAGWYQCEQFGAETHRKRPQDPPCGWQIFTE